MASVPSTDAIIESFPNQLPTIKGKPTYAHLRLARSLLKQNAASIPTNRGGGNNGYLGLILSAPAYLLVAPEAFDAPNWPGPTADIPAGATGPNIAHLVETHKEALREWREYNNVSAALKKQFIGSLDQVYIRARKDSNTGFANITLRDLLAYCMATYGKISPADIAHNEMQIRAPWNADTPFELMIEQIEDAQEYAEDARQPFTAPQILNTAYNLVYNTGSYFDECKTWNAKANADKTWDNFKAHFLEAQDNLRMQQTTSQRAGFHGANAMEQNNQGITQQIFEETSEALANLATATASDRKALETLTSTVANLTQQLSAKDVEIKKLKDQLSSKRNKPTTETPTKRTDQGSYCWSHGYLVMKNHNSSNCRFPKTQPLQRSNTHRQQGW